MQHKKQDFQEKVGLLKRGSIVGYDKSRGVMLVQLTTNLAIKGQNPKPVPVPIPYPLFYNGLFMGSLPTLGSTVIIGQGNGGSNYFVSFLAENTAAVPDVDTDTIKISAGDYAKITLSKSSDIIIGDDDSFIHINASSNLITSNFDSSNHFTQGTRSVTGPIKRDLKPNTNFSQNAKLTSDIYDSKFDIIGLDPTVKTNSLVSGPAKNPAFVENRELVYEFNNNSAVNDDYTESLFYGTSNTTKTNFTFPNRRLSRADTLSLTLAYPNHLMETVKGTVVDIFGNILDINRVPLPVGKDTITLKGDNKKSAFLAIKELERKSIAFHFEINARKDLISSTTNQLTLPDINSNSDYARNRSRFFFDIDKEGQFKINVPASSERGNISLLTRYENYSTTGDEDNNNPNKLIFRKDNLDILHDSFAAPSINLINDGVTTNTERGSIVLSNDGANGAPIDRITGVHIKHGTVYHDILNTCYAHQSLDRLAYPNEWGFPVFPLQTADIPILTNVVSNKINVSGDNANAGGRSGSINLDGSLELNIGANTIDRQSLWLDTAGGIVANIGRDRNNNSAVVSMDGNVIWQIGGFGVSTDSRFSSLNNGQIGASLDIRILNKGGFATLIRVDDSGNLSIISPGNMAFHSNKNISFSADGNISVNAESLILQDRLVNKVRGGSI
jgi:hypothetical protein